jgi:outer membrane PBP1 activator LpoA protein
MEIRHFMMSPSISCLGRLLISGLLASLLAGCETVPVPTTEPRNPQITALEEVARTLVAEGKFLAAAEVYSRLASTASPTAADDYRLHAVAALIEAGELATAKQYLAVPLAPTASRQMRARKLLLEASILLAEHHPGEVLTLLPPALPPDTTPSLVAQLHELRAQAYSKVGNHLESARERVQLELALTDPSAIAENRWALWSALANLTPEALAHVKLPPPDTLGGWIELAELSKQVMSDASAFTKALDSWRYRYPGHPANAEIVPELLEVSHGNVMQPTHIALLLPFEEPFLGAAEAIRDGFLAGWFNDDRERTQPTISVHNTANANITELYDDVVALGADFVVGPLKKKDVAVLAGNPHRTVPALALNYAEEKPITRDQSASYDKSYAPPVSRSVRLYQFALSPEMEAREVAERAWLHGYRRAAVLTPEGSWGERIANTFITSWEQLGGAVIGHQVYPTNASQLAEPVRKLLKIDEHTQRDGVSAVGVNDGRGHELAQRRNLDFIFMAAFPRQARQLRPQLRFFQASDIPVYATSHVFTGSVDAAADRDINGITFGDMPWILADQGPIAKLRLQMQDLWPQAMENYARLYGFGLDAYRIIPYLPQLDMHTLAEFPGVTGKLSLGKGHRINRKLTWARFKGGTPVVLDGQHKEPPL